jgi:hypothetical protein
MDSTPILRQNLQPYVHALSHINVITGGAARTVFTRFSFNGNSLGRANGFAKLAGNATFFTSSIATKSVFATETRGQSTLLVWVIDSVWWAEELLKNNPHATHQLCDQEPLRCLVEGTGALAVVNLLIIV